MAVKNNHNFLAFDLGAGSGRAMLGTLAQDRLELRELHRFPNRILERNGGLFWNLPGLFEEIKKGLQASMGTGVSLDGLGVDTWGVDFGLLSKTGELLELPSCYRDPRTNGAIELFLERMPASEIYRRTGTQFLQFNTLFQLYSMVRDPSGLLAQAGKLLFMPDLFKFLLSGIKETEFTIASTSQLLNLTSGDWDPDLLLALGIPAGLMPCIRAPGTHSGTLDACVAREIGIGSIPVIPTAGHDTASAVAAVPAREKEGWAYLSCGTWSLLGIELRAPILTEKARLAGFTNEGGVDNRIRFLKNINGLWLMQKCMEAWGNTTHKQVEEAILAAPALRSVVEPDHPDFLNPADMPRAIQDFCKRTGQPVPSTQGEIGRCILESLALKYSLVLESLGRFGPAPIKVLHMIGGGIQNQVLCQFTADATRIPVCAGPVEATAIGNVLVQAMAGGVVRDLEHLRRIVRDSFPVKEYHPRSGFEWAEAKEKLRKLGY